MPTSDTPRPETNAVAEPGDALSSSSVHVRNIAFTVISIAIVILLLQLMQSVLIPFVLGALLFYALDSAVDWLQKLRVPRAIGSAWSVPLGSFKIDESGEAEVVPVNG